MPAPPNTANAAKPDSKFDEGTRIFKGAERAAVLMLLLGERYATPIWKALDDDEIREISLTMANLGALDPQAIEMFMLEFVGQMSASGAVMGNIDNTERLLTQYLPKERVNQILEEIRGPAGRNMWEKLSNVQDNILASYLKNEYPQTVAVVLTKIRQDQAARVLGILPEEFALDVVNRMLRLESVQKDVLDRVEQTLRVEFMSNLNQTQRRDPHETMAEIFNAFDRQTEARFLTKLEEENRESADRIKSLMFTFDDLQKLDNGAIQTLLRTVDKDKLAIALKGAAETARNFFLSNLSSRAAKMLTDDMEVMGPIRIRDVEEAQQTMVSTAKDLAARGEITIVKNRSDDELVY